MHCSAVHMQNCVYMKKEKMDTNQVDLIQCVYLHLVKIKY